jgi:hypothetical protein
MGHAFGILMAHVGTLHSLRSFRRRLPWALGLPQTITKSDKNMSRNIIAIAAALAFATVTQVHASTIKIELSGEWWAQENTDIGGAHQVPLSVLKPFQATITIDPTVSTFDTFVIGKNYLTRFPEVSVQSSITSIGFSNPFGQPYASGSFATVSRYSASYAPFKIESTLFGFRELSGASFSDGGSGEWETKLLINSPNIATSIIKPISESDFLSALNTAKDQAQQYTVFYQKYATVYQTAAFTGYPYSGYIGGIQLNGYAHITNISSVPETDTTTLAIVGFFIAATSALKTGRKAQSHTQSKTL